MAGEAFSFVRMAHGAWGMELNIFFHLPQALCAKLHALTSIIGIDLDVIKTEITGID